MKEVLEKIEAVRESANSPESKRELDKIEDEFITWADAFEKSRASKKLEIEKKRLALSGEELRKCNIALPVFNTVIGALRKSIEAYNKRTGDKLTYDLGDIGEGLVNEKSEPWKGWVVFSPKAAWDIQVRKGRDLVPMPSMDINFHEKLSENAYTMDYFSIRFGDKEANITTGICGTRIPKSEELIDDLPMGKYEGGIKSIIRRLLELQLLMLDTKP
jgi:hypothetical protein